MGLALRPKWWPHSGFSQQALLRSTLRRSRSLYRRILGPRKSSGSHSTTWATMARFVPSMCRYSRYSLPRSFHTCSGLILNYSVTQWSRVSSRSPRSSPAITCQSSKRPLRSTGSKRRQGSKRGGKRSTLTPLSPKARATALTPVST